METSVQLQDLLSYALWPIIVVACLILAIILFFVLPKIIKAIKNRKKKEKVKDEPKPVKAKNISSIKSKYLKEMDQIERDFQDGNADIRETYQSTSVCIRNFVYEATNIQVNNYTLTDIKKLDMPELEALVEEYYSPEFAVESVGNTLESISKTKRAIEQWN